MTGNSSSSVYCTITGLKYDSVCCVYCNANIKNLFSQFNMNAEKCKAEMSIQY